MEFNKNRCPPREIMTKTVHKLCQGFKECGGLDVLGSRCVGVLGFRGVADSARGFRGVGFSAHETLGRSHIMYTLNMSTDTTKDSLSKFEKSPIQTSSS